MEDPNATRARYPRSAKAARRSTAPKAKATDQEPKTIGVIDPLKAGDDWATFEERLDLYFTANLIPNDKKVSVLLSFISVEVYEILKHLCDPDPPNTKLYADLISLLSKQFSPRQSVYRTRIQFDSLKQGTESISEWYAKVEQLAFKCQFGPVLESRFADKFVAGMRPGPILERLCEETIRRSLRDLLDLALSKEAALTGVDRKAEAAKARKAIQRKRKTPSDQKLCYCFTEEFDTASKLEYTFYANNNGYVKFKVRAANDAHIALTPTSAESNPMYEVMIGSWRNTKSVIRKNHSRPHSAEVLTPNILNGEEFRTFWICWDMNTISVGCDNNPQPFMKWTDSEHVPIRYVGFRTCLGATGSWTIHQGGAPLEGFNGGEGILEFNTVDVVGNNKWVAASYGHVPPKACVGGTDVHSTLYVVRCSYRGGLIPGKLHVDYRTAYIPSDGCEIEFAHYEVLCNCDGSWIPCVAGKIPPNAIVGGHSHDGELLYIGRVPHVGTVTIGKVQRSYGCCLISYGGREYKYQRYEILVSEIND